MQLAAKISEWGIGRSGAVGLGVLLGEVQRYATRRSAAQRSAAQVPGDRQGQCARFGGWMMRGRERWFFGGVWVAGVAVREGREGRVYRWGGCAFLGGLVCRKIIRRSELIYPTVLRLNYS